MITTDDYIFPRTEKPKRELTVEEKERRRETLEYLESLPFRPFTCEW